MPPDVTRHTSLLDCAYTELDLVGGTLLASRDGPTAGVGESWREHGDWLLLARRVGAERMFFVNDDPVFVFSTLPEGAGEAEVVDLYRRAWSLARPRCLFVAIGGELRVYALSQSPVAPGTAHTLEPLEIVHRTADVGT